MLNPGHPSFDSVRDTLKRTIRVEKVRVWNLPDSELEKELEEEMMGKEEDTGCGTNYKVPASGVEYETNDGAST